MANNDAITVPDDLSGLVLEEEVTETTEVAATDEVSDDLVLADEDLSTEVDGITAENAAASLVGACLKQDESGRVMRDANVAVDASFRKLAEKYNKSKGLTLLADDTKSAATSQMVKVKPGTDSEGNPEGGIIIGSKRYALPTTSSQAGPFLATATLLSMDGGEKLPVTRVFTAMQKLLMGRGAKLTKQVNLVIGAEYGQTAKVADRKFTVDGVECEIAKAADAKAAMTMIGVLLKRQAELDAIKAAEVKAAADAESEDAGSTEVEQVDPSIQVPGVDWVKGLLNQIDNDGVDPQGKYLPLDSTEVIDVVATKIATLIEEATALQESLAVLRGTATVVVTTEE